MVSCVEEPGCDVVLRGQREGIGFREEEPGCIDALRRDLRYKATDLKAVSHADRGEK